MGDGCTSGKNGCVPYPGPFFTVEFFHGHGQFSTRTYNKIRQACSEHDLLHGVPFSQTECREALAQMDRERGFCFAYNLYDECYDFALGSAFPEDWEGVSASFRVEQREVFVAGRGAGGTFGAGGAISAAPPAWERFSNRHKGGRKSGLTPSWHMDGEPCGGTAVLPKWALRPEVKAALGVAPDAAFFDGDNGVGFTYIYTEKDVRPWYKSIAEANMGKALGNKTDGSIRIGEVPTSQNAPKIRMLIYNGDTDPGLNSFLGERWTSELGLEETEGWRPWTRDGKV